MAPRIVGSVEHSSAVEIKEFWPPAVRIRFEELDCVVASTVIRYGHEQVPAERSQVAVLDLVDGTHALSQVDEIVPREPRAAHALKDCKRQGRMSRAEWLDVASAKRHRCSAKTLWRRIGQGGGTGAYKEGERSRRTLGHQELDPSVHLGRCVRMDCLRVARPEDPRIGGGPHGGAGGSCLLGPPGPSS